MKKACLLFLHLGCASGWTSRPYGEGLKCFKYLGTNDLGYAEDHCSSHGGEVPLPRNGKEQDDLNTYSLGISVYNIGKSCHYNLIHKVYYLVGSYVKSLGNFHILLQKWHHRKPWALKSCVLQVVIIQLGLTGNLANLAVTWVQTATVWCWTPGILSWFFQFMREIISLIIYAVFFKIFGDSLSFYTQRNSNLKSWIPMNH